MNRFRLIGLCLFLGLLNVSLSAQAIESGLLTQVKGRFTEFSNAFPDIAFMHIKHPDDVAIVRGLAGYLGSGAQDGVYEHDADVQQVLLDAQFERILLMTRNNWPSSTLFRTGQQNIFNKPFLCVVTLALAPFETDPDHASRMLLGSLEPLSFIEKPEARLDNGDFVLFTLDHELFHCVDAYLNGPTIKQSTSEIGACYQLFRSEQRADIFAALGFRQQQPSGSDFLNRLFHYRSLSLLDGDTAHFTISALSAAQRVPVDRISDVDLNKLTRFSMRLAETSVPSETEFGSLLSATFNVLFTRGLKHLANANVVAELTDEMYSPTQVARLRRNILDAEAALLVGAMADRR